MKTIFKLSFVASIDFFLLANIASAQLIPDSTLGEENSQVNSTDNQQKIEGGAIRGNNLFHSFQEFNVDEQQEVLFNNPTNIENILTRVTGGNLSKIDGVISNVGQANLFLINPAGIIFGEGAALNLGGSFYGSTADSIVFPDGEFSATDLDDPPLLTINVPIGLNFRDEPGNIINRSTANNNLGLQVKPGQTISLVGGELNFEGGRITASGANVWLGSLSTSGTVAINNDGSFTFPEGVARGNVFLSDNATINTTGGGGVININAHNLTLTEHSQLFTGISLGMGSSDAVAGDIVINATDSITIDESKVSSAIKAFAIGNAGDINLTSPIINIDNNSEVIASTFSLGNAGAITITASNSLTISDSKLLAQVKESAVGNAGDIKIVANFLTVDKNSFVIVDSNGEGDAGDITLEISDKLLLDRNSLIRTGIETNGIGKGGQIKIHSSQIFLNNSSTLSSGTLGQGTGGNVRLITNLLSLDNVSNISSASNKNATENGGKILISSGRVIVNNESGINVFTTSKFNGGEIKINANTIELKQGGNLFAATNSKGDAGNIQLNITERIIANGANTPSDVEPPGSPVLKQAIGKTGLLANTLSGSEGDGGNIIIGVFKQEGNNLVLNENQYTEQIVIANNAEISANSVGIGKGGMVEIRAEDLNLDRGTILASTNSLQPENTISSEINLLVQDDLVLQNDSSISAKAINNAMGGNVNIDAKSVVAYLSNGQGNDILANAEQGKGGNINITAEALFGIEERRASNNNNNTSDIDASSNFGLNGNISLETLDVDRTSGIIELPNTPIDTEAILAKDICKFEGDKIAKGSSFIITGRGGLTPTSKEPLDNLDNVVRWANRDEIQVSQNGAVGVRQRSTETSYPIIKQSQGWVKTSDGSVWLVANSPQNPEIIHPNCGNLKLRAN